MPYVGIMVLDLITLFRPANRLKHWSPTSAPEPLDHPDIQAMSQKMLADLPYSAIEMLAKKQQDRG